MLLKSLPFSFVVRPIFPSLRTIIPATSPRFFMIYYGWQIFIWITYAKLSIVFYVKFLKNSKLSKIFLFDSLRKSALSYRGRVEMKLDSSSKLNFFLMFVDSSM